MIVDMSVEDQYAEAYNAAARMGHRMGIEHARLSWGITNGPVVMNSEQRGAFDATLEVLDGLFPEVERSQLFTVLTQAFEAGKGAYIRHQRRTTE
jgi:hypothetical protein